MKNTYIIHVQIHMVRKKKTLTPFIVCMNQESIIFVNLNKWALFVKWKSTLHSNINGPRLHSHMNSLRLTRILNLNCIEHYFISIQFLLSLSFVFTKIIQSQYKNIKECHDYLLWITHQRLCNSSYASGFYLFHF